MKKLFIPRIILLTLLMFLHAHSANAVTFTPLGFLGNQTSSFAMDISGDGSTVVGYSSSDTDTQAFYWKAGTMMGSGTSLSAATAVNQDGSIIVGAASFSDNNPTAMRWDVKQGAVENLGNYSEVGGSSRAYGVSADGFTVAGRNLNDSIARSDALHWRINPDLDPRVTTESLGFLPESSLLSASASDISADGKVIVGNSRNSSGAEEAARWVYVEGKYVISSLGAATSFATAVSADGKYIVGLGATGDAFLWSSDALIFVPKDPNDPEDPDNSNRVTLTKAWDVSADGAIVVGEMYIGEPWWSGDKEAFIWDKENGRRRLQDVLEADLGCDNGQIVHPCGWTLISANGISDDGSTIVGWGVNPSGQQEAWVVTLEGAPTADAGPDQSIHAGDSVILDGSASDDDNTDPANLIYAWSFISYPSETAPEITPSATNPAKASFVANMQGTYTVQLMVTDEAGRSGTDEVVISSNNLAPTAEAGSNRLVIVGMQVTLDGSGSKDPNDDPLDFAWSLRVPDGSSAILSKADTVNPSFIADVIGDFPVELVVSDFIGPGAPDTVVITASTAEDYSESRIISSGAVVAELTIDEVTSAGNQEAISKFLIQAVTAIQSDDTARAIQMLEHSLERTDGCTLRGEPDGNGPGRDWITVCTQQEVVYNQLLEALYALIL